MNNIKEQIKQLQEIANGNRCDRCDGRIDVAKQALAIIKELKRELWLAQTHSDDCENWNQQLREENEKLKASVVN